MLDWNGPWEFAHDWGIVHVGHVDGPCFRPGVACSVHHRGGDDRVSRGFWHQGDDHLSFCEFHVGHVGCGVGKGDRKVAAWGAVIGASGDQGQHDAARVLRQMLVTHVLADGVFVVLDAVPAAEANLSEFHRDAAGGTVCVPREHRPEPDFDVVLGFGHGVTDREVELEGAKGGDRLVGDDHAIDVGSPSRTALQQSLDVAVDAADERQGWIVDVHRQARHASFVHADAEVHGVHIGQQRAGVVGGPGAHTAVGGHGPHFEGEVVRRALEGVCHAPKALFRGSLNKRAGPLSHGALDRGLKSARGQRQAVRGAGGKVEVKHGHLHARGGRGCGGLLPAVPRRQHHDFEANGVHTKLAVVRGSFRDVVQSDRQVGEFIPGPVGWIVEADAVGLAVHVIDASTRVGPGLDQIEDAARFVGNPNFVLVQGSGDFDGQQQGHVAHGVVRQPTDVEAVDVDVGAGAPRVGPVWRPEAGVAVGRGGRRPDRLRHEVFWAFVHEGQVIVGDHGLGVLGRCGAEGDAVVEVPRVRIVEHTLWQEVHVGRAVHASSTGRNGGKQHQEDEQGRHACLGHAPPWVTAALERTGLLQHGETRCGALK